MERWQDYSVKPLFVMISTEMPPLRFRTPETKPLPDNVYVDIISYIFETNAFPAGRTELTPENLDRVQILGRNGVQPPPQFSLVLTVGCMTYRRVSWTIPSATEPVRATMPDISTKEEVAASKTKLLGLREFRLAEFGYLGRGFSAEELEGHRILVKGYIIRQREFDRISVTSVTDSRLRIISCRDFWPPRAVYTNNGTRTAADRSRAKGSKPLRRTVRNEL
jgi:hypothetical protein